MTVVLLILLTVGLLAVSAAAVGRRPLVAVLGAAAVFGARSSLVWFGYVRGDDIRWLDVTVGAALALVAVACRDLARAGSGPEGGGAGQPVAFVAALVALPAAFVGLGQLIGPSAARETGVDACDGAAVAGAAFVARTGEFGLNARAGPSTTYEPEGRFGVACAVGADGYCVGEAVNDVSVPLPDVRWLRLRHTERYASSGTLFALSPESDLGDGPEPDCPDGLADPDLPDPPQAVLEDPETVLITAVPARTPLVGFALYYPGADAAAVEQLGIVPKRVDEAGRAYARLSLPPTRARGADEVILAVVPCLAPVVPAHSGERLLRIDLRTGASSAAPSDAVPDDALPRLRQAGCRVDPSASNEQIADSAVSKGP